MDCSSVVGGRGHLRLLGPSFNPSSTIQIHHGSHSSPSRFRSSRHRNPRLVGITTAFSKPASVQKFVSEGDLPSRPGPKPREAGAQLQGQAELLFDPSMQGWCSAGKNIAPTLSQLKAENMQEPLKLRCFRFGYLSDRASTAQIPKQPPASLGSANFFAANKKPRTGSLTHHCILPTGKILAQHRNNPKQIQPTQKFLTLQSQGNKVINLLSIQSQSRFFLP